MVVRAERKIAGRTLVIETGKLARQADGAVMVQYGDTVVLVAATAGGVREGADFFPFFVDFRERSYAAGLIQGTRYDKREGRPTENEILTMRMMDRPVRPFFPDHYRNEVQVESLVLSADADNEPSVLGMIGTPAALLVSPIPYAMPIGSVRVGFVKGDLIAFPTRSQLAESLFDLVISATRDKVVMIELGAREATEKHVAEAIRFAHDVAREIVAMQEELVNAVKPVKTVVPAPAESPAYGIIKERFLGEIQATLLTQGKPARLAAVDRLKGKVCQALLAEPREPKLTEDEIGAAFHLVAKGVLRKMALQGARCDGRTPHQLRPITCEVEVLPRTHGSALFTRGETQTLVVTTLGTEDDEQIVRGLTGEWSERFLLHYNFPPFSVGEVGRIGAPSRRDIGHGALARKALLPVIPPESEFPYAIRVVSDVLESCASSSMASVCGGTLSLLDAGIPLKKPVAGLSIGMVEEDSQVQLLADVIDEEDFSGDMDFKVAGTADGVTAIQLDVKNDGLRHETIAEALALSRECRLQILDKMNDVIAEPRDALSVHAPRVLIMQINVSDIGKVIGPGGATIRSITDRTGAEVDIADDGIVKIMSKDSQRAEEAQRLLRALVTKPQVGDVFDGMVKAVKEYGAFVEIAPGTDGLCHISELSQTFVKDVNKVVKVGDKFKVKVIAIDNQGRIKLSRKAAEAETPGAESEKPA